MQIQLETQSFDSLSTEAVVTYVFEKDNRIEGLVGALDQAMQGKLSQLASIGELTGKPYEMVLIHFPAGLAAQRLERRAEQSSG